MAALAENGYAGTNMDDIASRAGVGKAAIYRRWSSKAALITDALVYWKPALLIDDIPDTGSLEGDLNEIAERAARNADERITYDLILRVAVEAMNDSQLASALDDLTLLRGRRTMTAILKNATARGEIAPDTDWSLVPDVLTAMLLMRAIRGERVDANYVRKVIDTVIVPAVRATAY